MDDFQAQKVWTSTPRAGSGRDGSFFDRDLRLILVQMEEAGRILVDPGLLATKIQCSIRHVFLRCLVSVPD